MPSQEMNDNFTSRKIRSLKVNTKILLFSKLYRQTNFTYKLVLSIFLGIVMSLASVIFAESTGLYVGGFNAFFQGIARFVRTLLLVKADNSTLADIVYNILFWGLYLVLNAFLFVFSYKKIGKQFTILTAGYLIALQLFGFIWSYFVPAIGNLQIFGDTKAVDQDLARYEIKMLTFSGLDTTENMIKVCQLLIYAIVFAVINSFVSAFLFIIGSSTAGSDIVSIYWSQEKNKSVGSILMAILSSFMFMGVLIGSYGSSLLVNADKYYGHEYLISGNLFCSFIWIIFFTTFVNHLFPWKKYTRVEIYTTDDAKIRNFLKKVKYPHPTTIISAIGGYSGQNKQILVTICMLIEVPTLIELVRKVDESCLISTQYTDDLDGQITTQQSSQ